MHPQIVFMFTGQGSQYFQMGRELYEQHPVFRRVVDQGEAHVRRRLGRSLTGELYGRPRADPFDDLALSHPALMVVGCALAETLVAEGIRPDMVWGSSLGELIAGVCAGVWSFESALETVMEQARLVTQTCPPGGMLAVLADPALFAQLRDEGHALALAGINFHSHFTVSGPSEALARAQAALSARGVTHQRLPVGYAFHSSAVDPIEQPFLRFCSTLPFNHRPRTAFLSSACAGPLTEVTPQSFWSAVRGPMRFRDAAQRLEAGGASVFVDCGPSATAATLVKYNLSRSSGSVCFPVLSPYHQGLQQLERLKQHLQQHA